MRSDLLHVIAVINNPIRWHSRLRLFLNFIRHMRQSGVRLHLVECAHGDRPYEVPEVPEVYNLIRVRTNSICWIKENLINIAISRLPEDWKYVAWVDADIFFRHRHWASEAVHALQQYPIIQPWASCIDLGPNHEVIEHHKSFAYLHWHNRLKGIGKGYEFCHPGYAWCARREFLERVGGLIEFAIAGAGDHHMALAMVNKVQWSIPKGVEEEYRDPLLEWQRRAIGLTQKHIGFLPGAIEHFWHGRKCDRKYIERWDIIVNNHFEPDTDIKKNTWGVITLAGNKPQLEIDLDHYMRQRCEDLTWRTSPYLEDSEGE